MRRRLTVATILAACLGMAPATWAAPMPIDVIYTGNEGGITGNYLAVDEIHLFAGRPDWELNDVALNLPAFRQGRYMIIDPDGRLTKTRFVSFFEQRPLRLGQPATAAYARSNYGQFLQWPPSRGSWVLDALSEVNGSPPRFPDLDQRWATVRPIVNAAGDRLWLVRDEGWKRPAAPAPDFEAELWADPSDVQAEPVAAGSESAAQAANLSDRTALASDVASRPAQGSDQTASASDSIVHPKPSDLDLSGAMRWEPMTGAQGRLRHEGQEARLIMLARTLGSWDRRMNLIQRLITDRPHSLLLSVGNSIDRARATAGDQARKESWAAIKKLPYDAFLPSQAEFRLPVGQFRQLSEDLPLVAANVVPPDESIKLPPYRIVDVQGTPVAIVGIVDREGLRDAGVAKNDAGWTVHDPYKAARNTVADLRKQGYATIVLLTDMSHAALNKLETDISDVSLIVGDARTVSTDQSYTQEIHYDWPAEARHPQTPLTVCPRPYRIGRVRLMLDKDYRHTYLLSATHEARRIGDEQPGDPRLAWHVVDLSDAQSKHLDYPLLPDVRSLGISSTIQSGDMTRWRMYTSLQWTRIAAGIVRERIGAELVLLPKLNMFTNIAGQIPAYMVASWLAGDDRLYRIELTGAQLQQISTQDTEFQSIVGAGFDPKVNKVGGRDITSNERYVAIVSDRVMDNARFSNVFSDARRGAQSVGDLRPLVLGTLEATRLASTPYPAGAADRFTRWMGDDGATLAPRWAVSLDEVGVDALSIQNHNQKTYAEVRNARINTQDNSALGGSGKLTIGYSSSAINWTSKAKAVYRQMQLIDKTQETADDLVFSSELRLNLFQIPVGKSALPLTPYLLASYDTEFTPSLNTATNTLNPLQQDFDGIAGLALSPGGPWQDVKLGLIGRYDLHASLFRPGVQVATGFERVISDQFPVKLRLGGDLRYYMSVATPTPDQLGFLGDVSAALVVPIWQNLNLTVGVTGLIYRGQAAPQDIWGASVNPTVGISYGGVWKPQWGVIY
jgi:2',3'-cyclic-nucleotide 2'-phosphodiesterase (5'-nucleotidase family)